MDAMQAGVTDVEMLIRGGFGWRFGWAGTLLAGTTVILGMVVGPYGAILLDRAFSTDGDDTTFTLYRGTSWTGGTTWTPANWNDRFWASAARIPTTSAAIGVTATPLAANAMGAVRLHTVGPKAASIYGEGSAIILAPGGSYVVAVTNNGATTSEDALSVLAFQDRVSSGLFDWRV